MPRTSTSQTTFNAGELTNLLWERVELKYFSTGCSYAENVKVLPQGGFSVREGLRDVGAVAADAARLFPFKASSGASYDVVVKVGGAAFWSATAELDTVTISGLTEDMLPEMTTLPARKALMPLPFCPVPPDAAPMRSTRLPLTMVPSSAAFQR